MLLRVGLVKSQLVGQLTPALRHRLRASLSYENLGHIIQRRKWYRRTGKHNYPGHLKWDGVTRLFSDTQKFPAGLTDRVIEICRANGVEPMVVNDFKIAEPKPLTLPIPIQLWDHQRDAIEEIKKHRHGVIRIGTGGGKSRLSIVATAEIGQLPVLFVVNRVSLLTQAHQDYEKLLGIKVGFIGDGQMTFGKVNIATVHTLCSILKIEHEVDDEDKKESVNYTEEQINMLLLMLKATRMVIVDECHHSASDMYIKLLDQLPNATYRIGLSATPFRTDGLDIMIEAAFGKTLYTKPASDLILDGVLAKPHITFVDYDDPLTLEYPYQSRKDAEESFKSGKKKIKKAQYKTVYKNCVVENDTFNRLVAKIALASAKMKRLTLVSVKQVAHGNALIDAIKSIDPHAKATFLHGGNKKELNEEKVKSEFASHKIEILISTLFDEGVDIPAIDVAIDAGGGKSPIKTLQLVGRAMRKYPGKEKAYIYMFIQRYTYLYNHSEERLDILLTEPEFVIDSLKI